MKKVLIFGRSDICYDSLNAFSICLSEAFRNNGVEADLYDISSEGAIVFPDNNIFEENDYDAAIAFNAGGQHNSKLPDGQNIFDHYGIPFLNYILDHPIVHHGNMISSCRNYHIICIDRYHVDFVKKYYPGVAGAWFQPVGGMKPTSTFTYDYDSYESRLFDVIFTGSYNDFRLIDEEINTYPRLLQDLVWTQIDILLDNRKLNVEQALGIALEEIKIPDDIDKTFLDFAVATRIVNQYIKVFNREEKIRQLAHCLKAMGRQLHIWGSRWEFMPDPEPDSIILHTPVKYDVLGDVFLQARVGFNCMPWFKAGLHDRIPTAMEAGAAVLTDHSEYTREMIPHDDHNAAAFFYDVERPETIMEALDSMFEDTHYMFEVARRGRELDKAQLSWNSGAQNLIKIIDSINRG